MIRRAVLFFLLTGPLLAGPADQKVSFTASVDRNRVEMGSQFELTFTLEGATGRVSVATQYRDRNRTEWTIDLAADGQATITTTNWSFGSSYASFRKQYEEMQPEEYGEGKNEKIRKIKPAHGDP